MTDRARSYRDLLIAKADGQAVSDDEMRVLRQEEDLIRSAITYPRAVQDTGLNPSHFEGSDYRMAWAAVQRATRVHQGEGPLRAENVLAEMRRGGEGRFAAGAGALWMASVQAQPATSVEYTLEVLVPQTIQRHQLKRWKGDFGELFERIDKDPDTLGLFQEVLTETHRVATSPDGGRLGETMEEIASLKTTTAGYVPTGIPQIDDPAGGGLGRGDMCVAGGGTGHGKSYFAERVLRNQARMNRPTLYVSAEDPKLLMLCRMLADYSHPRLPPVAFLRYAQSVLSRVHVPGAVTAQQWQDALGALTQEQQGRVYYAEARKWTVSQICSLIRRHRYMAKIDLVVVDYLQAIQPDEQSGYNNRTQEVARIVAQLKKCCGDCGVALVLMSQYARDEYREGQEPTINACKYAGDIENEAEVLVLFWRDDEDRLHAKIPKVKWAKAKDLRYLVDIDPHTGTHLDWQDDLSPRVATPAKGGRRSGAVTT